VESSEDKIIILDNSNIKNRFGSRRCPQKIVIDINGLRLFFSSSHEKFILWSELRSIHTYANPRSFLGRDLPSYGGISIWTENVIYFISYQNAALIKQYFIKNFGQNCQHVCAMYDDHTKWSHDYRSFYAPYSNRDVQTVILYNRFNRSEISTFTIIALAVIANGIIGAALGYIQNVIFIILGIIIFLSGVYSEYVHRPTMVEVRKDGVQLSFRYGKPKNYSWDQMMFLLWNPRDTVRKDFKRKGDCAIQFKGELPYPINDEIGLVITEAYTAVTGKNPPDKTRNG